MSDGDWKDDDSGDWVDDTKPGQLESGLRGAAQGLSLGFADEITGALESAFTDKTYEQARDESRANYKSAKDANPITYGAGEIGGGVATSFVPGLNIAKGASLAQMAGKAALAGGAMGLGKSEADNVRDMAIDTGKGALIGGATGGAINQLGRVGAPIKNVIDDVATAPIGKAGDRGLVASALNKAHQAGAAGNKMVDDVLERVTPSSGSAQTDQMINSIVKGASKLGRYGLASKAQGALDTLEQGPKVAQWAAGKASPLLEKLGNSEFAQGLAQRSPQVFNAVAQKINQPKERFKPYEPEQIIEKTQGSKYAKVVTDAAQRGQDAFGATHFILQSTQPEYRALTLDQEDESKAGEPWGG